MRDASAAKPGPYHPAHTRAASAGLHAAPAAPSTTTITTGDDTMQLKRNMMTLALISAGIGFATCANVAFAASAPAGGAHDQAQSQTDQSGTNAQQTDQKGSKKEANKKETKKPQYTKLQTVQVNGFVSSIENSTALKPNATTLV
jgi:iron complex outermembrane receptor protein